MDPLFAGLLGGILSSLRVVQCVVSVSVVHNNKPNVSFLLCSLLAADTNTAQHHNNITALIFISTHLSLQSVAVHARIFCKLGPGSSKLGKIQNKVVR